MGNPVRFGDFEVDLRAGELLKRGHKIKLQEKPFQILEILLEQPGEMVGRQELAERLWPADTFVDFERGLNTAIGKLRTALGDSAEKPRYIETVARRGYRFIGSIEGSESEEPSSGRRWSPALVTLAFVVLGTALVLGLRGGFIVEAPTEVIDSVAVLIDATPEEHLWTETYERDLRDVLALQSEVARRIADEIRVKLTPQEAVRLASARPVDPEAHDAYLRGLFYFHEAINQGHRLDRRVELHKRSLEQFRQAIEIEPDYAQAYAGVARSHHWLASFGFPESYPKAKEAALKALEIDETIADAHSALAFTLHNYDWDWPGAEGHYNQAIELNPNAGNAGHHGYAIYLSAAGRHSEAITMIRRAEELDPLVLPLKANVAMIYTMARQYKRAIQQAQHVVDLYPDGALGHATLGRAYALDGQHQGSPRRVSGSARPFQYTYLQNAARMGAGGGG